MRVAGEGLETGEVQWIGIGRRMKPAGNKTDIPNPHRGQGIMEREGGSGSWVSVWQGWRGLEVGASERWHRGGKQRTPLPSPKSNPNSLCPNFSESGESGCPRRRSPGPWALPTGTGNPAKLRSWSSDPHQRSSASTSPADTAVQSGFLCAWIPSPELPLAGWLLQRRVE